MHVIDADWVIGHNAGQTQLLHLTNDMPEFSNQWYFAVLIDYWLGDK